jgi:hypothetical protein
MRREAITEHGRKQQESIRKSIVKTKKESDIIQNLMEKNDFNVAEFGPNYFHCYKGIYYRSVIIKNLSWWELSTDQHNGLSVMYPVNMRIDECLEKFEQLLQGYVN